MPPTPDDALDVALLSLAVDLATANVAAGGGPFGALVVRSDTRRAPSSPSDPSVVATGVNRVTRDHDPTAHAEVEALRAAGRALGTHVLTGTTLYASCEPCPLCLAAALWGRVDRVVYAADRHDAAAAGFDDALFHDVIAGRAAGVVAIDQVGLAGARSPFEEWAASAARQEY